MAEEVTAPVLVEASSDCIPSADIANAFSDCATLLSQQLILEDACQKSTDEETNSECKDSRSALTSVEMPTTDTSTGNGMPSNKISTENVDTFKESPNREDITSNETTIVDSVIPDESSIVNSAKLDEVASTDASNDTEVGDPSKSDSNPADAEDLSQPTSSTRSITPKINIMSESTAEDSEPGLDDEESPCDPEDEEDVNEEEDDVDPDANADETDEVGDEDIVRNYLESDEDSPEHEVKEEVEEEEEEDDSEVGRLLKRRMQPIHELVYSEQSYVKRLRIIKDRYMPCIDEGTAEVPEDLANKWRILWGNWLQLDEWHSAFLEKLERLVKEDPDQIPKLFIDYRARLRNIYSKYCENHRKAALIAEQYKEFFDELRVKVADKEDVVSHLMQPVQRIMRYQLPMGEIVKYTERAALPSIGQWRKALDIMKEIPKDTQLILEAARIDGFPGVITSLGNLRIRGELLMATTSKSDINQSSFTASELKFVERRLFLFDQMLLFTEETKPKRKDSFAQSTYQFKHALNVNKMKFESHFTYAGDDDEHDMRFVIREESPGKEAVFILDPGSIAVREAWVIQLRDLQMMQQELLLALTDPKRFAAGGGSGGGSSSGLPPASPFGNPSGARSGKEKSHHLSVDRTNSEGGSGQKKKKQKWPSFTKKARSRTEEIHLGKQHQQPQYGSTERLSAPVDGSNLMRKESLSNTTCDTDPNSSALKHRSWSGFSLRLRRSKRDLRKTPGGGNSQSKDDPGGPGTSTASSTGAGGKKKSLFSNLFGKNKH